MSAPARPAPTRMRGELVVEGLSFQYPRAERPVLRGMSLRVAPGESVGVLGPNGSGKSTFLSALLEARSGHREGTVTLAGARAWRRELVGYATQEVALYPQLTAAENLRHMARILCPPERVAGAVTATLDEFGLRGRAHEPVHRLSGGWQRLTHLAASFVHDPPLRLLDEPTTALDFETRSRLVELTRRWRIDGCALLVTSHYPEDIEQMCTHAVVVRDGVVARHAPVPELMAAHRRELLLETTDAGTSRQRRLPVPRTVAELRDYLLHHADGRERLKEIRTTGARLRDALAADPHLRGAVDDE
ncbi:ABC transporter ATP-binding protein [Kineosporia sp. J2-2]|uniref:ABC transporter ATP-binding protein n=1 Tax=Kineosporia corallincola TaxID=2835133 RepID=A0ABS5TG22_9ACTN|nr:ABC transporter ATP-binding protein [Kineosporia corallincola]MBT0770045.1 ABC transporter ATP-binding protein [Kineosporia corallincola]